MRNHTPLTPTPGPCTTTYSNSNRQLHSSWCCHQHHTTKAMDMRFHLLRCRENQKQFRIYWWAGATNLADYVIPPSIINLYAPSTLPNLPNSTPCVIRYTTSYALPICCHFPHQQLALHKPSNPAQAHLMGYPFTARVCYTSQNQC